MKEKKVQLYLTRNATAIRHGITALAFAALLAFALLSIANQGRLLRQNAKESDEIVQLSKDNKRLSQENNKLAQKNQNAVRCLGTVLSKYTRDFIPIVIKDYDNCTIQAGSQAAQTYYPSTTGVKQTPPQTYPHAAGAHPPQSAGGGSSKPAPKPKPKPTPTPAPSQNPVLDLIDNLTGGLL